MTGLDAIQQRLENTTFGPSRTAGGLFLEHSDVERLLAIAKAAERVRDQGGCSDPDCDDPRCTEDIYLALAALDKEPA